MSDEAGFPAADEAIDRSPHDDADTRRSSDVDAFAAWATAAGSMLSDREDLVARVEAAFARATRQSTVVAVVGEFKQGKSALVNSMLGVALCPVDDHVATSVVTVVSHAQQPSVLVRRRGDDGSVDVVQVDPATRRDLITEAGDASPADATFDRASIERVDIRVPNELLADGLVVVDTPGVGGMRPSHAAATRAFLPSADVLVFVSDATSELTETEVSFLAEATDVCPHVVLALTKTDLFPHWRRIRDLDRAHLAAAGVSAPIFPVSYPLRIDARRGADTGDDVGARIDTESGYPELLEHLAEVVLPQARAGARDRSVDEIVDILRRSADVDRAELAVLTDPSRVDDDLERLGVARARLAGMTDGGARWRTVLQDEVTDLSQDVTFRFRDRIRSSLDVMDAAVDEAGDRDELDAATEALRSAVVDAVQAAFADIETGVANVTRSVGQVLGLDELDIGTFEEIAAASHNADAGWRDTDGSKEGSVVGDVFSAVRGAQGGILMLAVMGGLLPAAAATAVAAAPFMVGAGVLFGGKSIVDLRSQRRQRARQRLKATLRKSVDDVQFRVGNELGEALRAAQRHLRDELSARIEEVHRNTTETIARLEQATSSDGAERERRRAELEARLRRLESLVEGPGSFPRGGVVSEGAT